MKLKPLRTSMEAPVPPPPPEESDSGSSSYDDSSGNSSESSDDETSIKVIPLRALQLNRRIKNIPSDVLHNTFQYQTIFRMGDKKEGDVTTQEALQRNNIFRIIDPHGSEDEMEEENQKLEIVVQDDDLLHQNELLLHQVKLQKKNHKLPSDMPEFGLWHVFILGFSLTKIAIEVRKGYASFLLDLSSYSISPLKCRLFSQLSLAFNKSICVLNISSEDSSSIKDEGCISLFDALCFNSSLISLTLSHNEITNASIPALQNLMERNTTLTHLNLSHNTISTSGMYLLATTLADTPQPSLISLCMNNNNLGNSSKVCLSGLIRRNKKLTELDISNCGISSGVALDIVAALEMNTTLCALHIQGVDLDPEHTAENIETDESYSIGKKLLGCHPSFQIITIAHAALPVQKCRESRWVKLPNVGLREQDVLLISSLLLPNSLLTKVDISGNPHVGRWAVLHLLQAIILCPRLSYLNISDTGLYTECGEALGTILTSSTTTLETLVVDIHELHVQQLLGSVPFEQETTSVSKVVVVSEDEEDSEDENENVDKTIRRNTRKVGSIVYRDGPLSLLPSSAGGPSNTVNYRNVPFSGIEMSVLDKLLSVNRSIECLNGLYIGHEMELWELSGVSFLSYEAVFIAVRMGHHAKLRSLGLANANITATGGFALAIELHNNVICKSINLERNDIRHSGNAFGEALCHNTTLTFLNLSWNSLGDEGVKTLGTALSTNRTLLGLELRGNGIGKKGIGYLAQGMLTNVTLTTLRLRWNLICPESAVELGGMLCKNRGLTHLDIDQHYIGPEGVKVICEALHKNKILTLLHLGGGPDEDSKIGLGSAGGESIARMLRLNHVLQWLYIGHNELTVDGAEALSHAMKFNKGLKGLDISSSDFDGRVSTLLFTALETHPSLTELNMERNAVGVSGSKAFTKMLLCNSCLTNVNVSQNDINEEGLVFIANSVSSFSKNLLHLNLLYNRVSDRTRARLQAASGSLQIQV